MKRWQKPTCRSGKAAYQTQGAALRALDVLRRENAQAVVPLPFTLQSAYRCRTCGAWHLTKQEGRVSL